MAVSVPASAPATPPLTGASTIRRPRARVTLGSDEVRSISSSTWGSSLTTAFTAAASGRLSRTAAAPAAAAAASAATS